MAGKRYKPICEQLRRAIRDSGLSLYRLERECGVNNAQLSRFMRGEQDLKGRSIDRLCKFLGLELRPTKRKGE